MPTAIARCVFPSPLAPIRTNAPAFSTKLLSKYRSSTGRFSAGRKLKSNCSTVAA